MRNLVLAIFLAIPLTVMGGTINSSFIESLEKNDQGGTWHNIGGDETISDVSVFDSVYLVWKHSENNWTVYSSVSSAQELIKDSNISIFSEVKPHQAVWVLKDISASSEVVNVSSGSGISQEQISALSKGWHNLATGSDISDLSIFDEVSKFWFFDENSSWKNLESVTTIPENRGFWIYATEPLIIENVGFFADGREVSFEVNLTISQDVNFSIWNGESLLHSGENSGTFVLDYGEYNLTVCANSELKEDCQDYEVDLGIDGLKSVPLFERVLKMAVVSGKDLNETWWNTNFQDTNLTNTNSWAKMTKTIPFDGDIKIDLGVQSGTEETLEKHQNPSAILVRYWYLNRAYLYLKFKNSNGDTIHSFKFDKSGHHNSGYIEFDGDKHSESDAMYKSTIQGFINIKDNDFQFIGEYNIGSKPSGLASKTWVMTNFDEIVEVEISIEIKHTYTPRGNARIPLYITY